MADIQGTNGADNLTGTNNDDTITGLGGDDTLIGADGEDSIYGGDGNDTIDGGLGGDTIDGGAGNDTIDGGAGNDTIDGNAGADLIYGGEGDDLIRAGTENDIVYAGDGTDSIYGGAGDDTLYGEAGADVIHGEDGNDVIYGGDGPDSLFGGAGDDIIYAGDGYDYVQGDLGDDVIHGGGDNDLLYGGDGADTFIIDTLGSSGVNNTTVNGDSGGNDYDTLDITALLADGWEVTSYVKNAEYSGNAGYNGQIQLYNASTGESANINFTDIEHIKGVPCFTPGTRIATPRGEVAVEELKVGDQVITRDNGLQEIRWVGRKELSSVELKLNPHLQPVLIRAGAFGRGLPVRDMLVSPNHRMLMTGERPELYFDEHEVLVSAKHLVSSAGVERVEASSVSYIHFMFDHHEVVLSDGTWSESFQPGDYAVQGVDAAARKELFELFPELESETGRASYKTARRTLRKHEALLMTE